MLLFGAIAAQYRETLKGRPAYINYCQLHRQYFAAWEARPVGEITKALIRAWHQGEKEKPSHSNKGLSYLKGVYNFAINAGAWDQANPVDGIKKHAEYSRDRVLIQQELQLLLFGIECLEPKRRAYLTLLLTTACRRGEACKMEWAHVDLKIGRWWKGKTKSGRGQWIPLPSQTRAALDALPRTGRYVFAGDPNGEKQYWSESSAEKFWGDLRSKCALVNVTIHDIRRTIASRIYAQERDWHLVQAVLNHYDGSPTAIYVRLNYDLIAQVLQKHADSLWALALPGPTDYAEPLAPLRETGALPFAEVLA